ncbi:hypothetical protein [Catenulispora subtropica]|uniref:Uncharacterized protein n=1 Tax=Catenulispora subtropica TaxID=450798 RepID=A0ABN2SR39_9ACTN
MDVWVEVTGGALVVVGFVVGGCTGALVDVGCGTGACVVGRGAGCVEVVPGFGAALVERADVTPGLPADEESGAGAPGPLGVPDGDPPDASATGALPPGADPVPAAGAVDAAFAPWAFDGSDPEVADFAEWEMTVVRANVVANPTCAVRHVSVDRRRSCESRRASRWPDEVMPASTAARMLRPR